MNVLNIYTFKSMNFGDGINKVFWEYITNKKIINNKSNIHYVTTGSIMCLINNKSIILGTGLISENGDIGGNNYKSKSSIKHNTPHKIIAVRGPLTRQKLLKHNIKCPENYGDPLILMPCMYGKKNNVENNIIGIIPHCVDKNNNNYKLLRENLKKKGYNVKHINIEVGENYKRIIDEINSCKYIISSSLHGVIMGIVYKKKTIFVEFSNKVIGNGFKFQDFFKSINITYKNINKYDDSIMNNVINVDYKYLQNIGRNFISLIPFIDKNRKKILTEKYDAYYNSLE